MEREVAQHRARRASAGSRTTTAETTSSPSVACGTPNVIASAMSGCRAKRRIDGGRRDLEAAAIDQLLHAAVDEQEPVVIDVAQIAGTEPAFEERLAVARRSRSS